jgi:WD40 repeat protein/tetratricopeptide (TPR) repeat protein
VKPAEQKPAEQPLRPLPPDTISDWLQALDTAGDSPDARRAEHSLWRLREAAAVLMAFDPARLRPRPGSEPFDEVARLKFLADLVAIEGAPPDVGFTLLTGVRQLALERLAARDPAATRAQLIQVLAANPDRSAGVEQRLLEEAIAGTLPAVESLNRQQLLALQSITSWLGGLVDKLPHPDDIERGMAHAEMMNPFQQLAGPWFVGRTEELHRLTDHVGVLPIDASAGTASSIKQYARRLTSSAQANISGQRRPLFVYGPGGVGKSSLLARFILDHTSGSDSEALPFAVVDIDRPSVDPLRPVTFLVEALGQLQHQLERFGSQARELMRRILDRERYDDTSAYETVIYQTPRLLAEFGQLMNSSLGSKPLVLIVDTFEEVQFLGPEAVFLVFNFLNRLQRAVPQLRIVVSGRAAPDGQSLYYLTLGELPPQAAAELLKRTLSSAGKPIPDAQTLDEIVQTIGGNPMVLRLAARLVAERDFEGLKEAGRREWLHKVRIETLQARLYGRVLSHVHDPEVRKLAFPGLVVRRVTPEVIADVLAEPCKLVLSGKDAPQRLVAAIAKEVALVSRDPRDGSLVYRPDIRRVMLETLDSTVPAETARAIDANAVAFWSRQSGAIARAEELYHRLRLAQPRDILDSRWMNEAAPMLRGALGEVSDGSRIWLANKLGAAVEDRLRSDATQPDWEEHAARSARRLLEAGHPDEALQVLRERTERQDGSALYALESRTLYSLERTDEARRVAADGVAHLSVAGDAPGLIDLHLLVALTWEKSGDLPAARASAEEALRLAEDAGVRLPYLAALVRLLRLGRRMNLVDTESYQAHRTRARGLIDDLGLTRISGDAALLRDAAAELGDLEPQLLSLAVERLGTEVLGNTRRDRLRTILETVVGMAPNIVASLIGGDLRELAKIAAGGIISSLATTKAGAESSRLTIAAFREASERAARLSGDPESSPASAATQAGASASPPASPQQLKALRGKILDRFNEASLRGVLQVYLSRNLFDYAPAAASFDDKVHQLVQVARQEGWLGDLTRAVERSTTVVAPRWTTRGELRGHRGEILRMNWHASGRFIATGSVDKTARIWDVSSHSEIARLEGHREGVNQAAWSPDVDASRLVTSSYDRSIRIWSCSDWTCIRTIGGHTDDVPDVAWSPDGRLLASASADRSLGIWDTATGELKGSVSRRKRGAARRVLWLDDGRILASCWEDGKLCLLSIDKLDSQTMLDVAGPGGGLIGVAFSPQRQLLAACSDKGLVRIWKWPSLEVARDIVAGRRDVRSVTFSADGAFLAANTYGRNGEVLVWRTDDWREFSRFSEPTSNFWPCNISWAPVGHTLATLTSADQVVRLREMSTADTPPDQEGAGSAPA